MSMDYNRLQLMLHANRHHFVSVQGGNSVIASYFAGTNVDVWLSKAMKLSTTKVFKTCCRPLRQDIQRAIDVG